MKIKMLQTVEDSHDYYVKVETNKGPKAQKRYVVCKYYQGMEYSFQNVKGFDKITEEDWDNICLKLIKLGYAKSVQ